MAGPGTRYFFFEKMKVARAPGTFSAQIGRWLGHPLFYLRESDGGPGTLS